MMNVLGCPVFHLNRDPYKELQLIAPIITSTLKSCHPLFIELIPIYPSKFLSNFASAEGIFLSPLLYTSIAPCCSFLTLITFIITS